MSASILIVSLSASSSALKTKQNSYATRTMTYTSTIIAPSGWESVPVFVGYPSTTGTAELGVQTDVFGFVVSRDARPLKTVTLDSDSNPTPTATAQKSENNCSAWKCWTRAEQAGTAFVAALIGLAILAVIFFGLCWKSKRDKMRVESERGVKKSTRKFFTTLMMKSDEDVEVVEAEEGRRRHRLRSSSTTNERVIPAPQDRRRRQSRRHVPRELSGSPDIARESVHEGENPTLRPYEPFPRNPSPSTPQTSSATVSRVSSHIPRPYQSPHLSHTDPQETSARSSFYKPRARDFAVPEAALAGADPVVQSRAGSSPSHLTARRELNRRRSRVPTEALSDDENRAEQRRKWYDRQSIGDNLVIQHEDEHGNRVWVPRERSVQDRHRSRR